MAWGKPGAKWKNDATAAPTVNDDITAQYEVGSVWIDVVAPAVYMCVDNTEGAAVWVTLG